MQIENAQPASDVTASRAALEAARTDAQAAEGALKVAQADLLRAKSDAEHARLDLDRADGLFPAALISKQDHDARKSASEMADAVLVQAQTKSCRPKRNTNPPSAGSARVRRFDPRQRCPE